VAGDVTIFTPLDENYRNTHSIEDFLDKMKNDINTKMNRNYGLLNEQLRQNYNPEGLEKIAAANSVELSAYPNNDIQTFIRSAMMAIGAEYTAISKEAGRRVENHLNLYPGNIDFAYQGSVMEDTHIKAYSDIDLLAVETAFYVWDRSNVSAILDNHATRSRFSQEIIRKFENERDREPYKESAIDSLKQLRLNCESTLSRKYNVCDVDKAKAIKIHNSDLNRDVDVVIANWYYDASSLIENKIAHSRGVQIYNKLTNSKGDADFPFRRIKLLNEKSVTTQGRLKRMIRFLKNCKVLLKNDLDISSFDINAIVYDIDTKKYINTDYLGLVPIVFLQLYALCGDQAKADALKAVDGKEHIFRGKPEKLNALRQLMTVVAEISSDLRKIAA